MFALMVRRERFGQLIQSGAHSINIPRPLMSKKKGNNSVPVKIAKNPEPLADSVDDEAIVIVPALSPEEEELLEQRKFLLPLMMTTNLGTHFWEMIFEEKKA